MFCHINVHVLFFFLVFLQERSGNNSFTHDALTLKYKLDNEFELLFVVSLFIYNNYCNPNLQGILIGCVRCKITNATYMNLFLGGFSKDPDTDVCGQANR